jgi:small-conductance mechanosensitive channel
MESMDRFIADYLTPPLPWLSALAGAVLVVIALEVVYRFGMKALTQAVAKTSTPLDDVLLRRMRLPAQVLVFLAGAHTLFALHGEENAAVSKAVSIVELLLVAYLAIEALETLAIDYWLQERKKTTIPGVLRGLGLLVLYTVATLSIVGSVTGINLAPILATSTVLTVVLGLALQDTLGNLFSGLALSFEKPFSVGDWILVDGVEGRIETAGWRGVHLWTFSGDIVVIPNAALARSRLQNFSRPSKTTSRNLEVQVRADAVPAEVDAALRAGVAGVSIVRAEPPPSFWFIAQSPLSQRWTVKVWFDDFAQHDESESVVMKGVVTELQKRGLALKPAAASVAA